MPKFQSDYSVTDAEYEVIKNVAEYHIACVFLIDTSYSMIDAIDKVNKAVEGFRQCITDKHDMACIEVSFISFGHDVKIINGLGPIKEVPYQNFIASGETPMGDALYKAMDIITERKALYKKMGTPYYRPWIFCITDGEPTDLHNFPAVIHRLKQMVSNKGVVDWCIGVGNTRPQQIKEIFDPERTFYLLDENYSGLFEWIASCLICQSNSGVPTGNIFPLPPTPPTLHLSVPT